MREAHCHLFSLGQSLAIPSLAGCTTASACLEAVRSACESVRRAGKSWARLHSARVSAWPEQAWPTLAQFDAATGGLPCVIMSFDHHSALANSAALAAAALTPGSTTGLNGVVVADERGSATGLLLEEAAYAAWEAAPPPTDDERLAMVAAGLAHLAALGFDEAHDLHSQAWLGGVLRTLESDGRLPIRVRLYAPAAELAAASAARKEWESPRLRLAGGKVFADGTLSSRTALLMHRYCHPLVDCPRGKAMTPPARIDEYLREADALGLPLAIHAIGDGAVKMVLDCYQRVRPKAKGQRLEHCELLDRTDVGRFVALGVNCSVQPCHLLADVETLHAVAPHRLDRVLPLRELLDSGLRPGVLDDDEGAADGPPGLVFGSDVPIVRANPEDSIRAAVARRREGAAEGEALAPAQAISETEAWRCFGVRPTDEN